MFEDLVKEKKCWSPVWKDYCVLYPVSPHAKTGDCGKCHDWYREQTGRVTKVKELTTEKF